MQGLLSRADDNRVALREIVMLELQALGAIATGRVVVRGEDVSLPMDHIQTLALGLHELATNAVKHGAFREEGGRLAIGWTLDRQPDGQRMLVLEWRESGLSVPPDASRRGFGRDLIERALGYTMQAATELQFGRDGVTCRIQIPMPAD